MAAQTRPREMKALNRGEGRGARADQPQPCPSGLPSAAQPPRNPHHLLVMGAQGFGGGQPGLWDAGCLGLSGGAGTRGSIGPVLTREQVSKG